MQPHQERLVRQLREITNGLSEESPARVRLNFRSNYEKELAELRQLLEDPFYVGVFEAFRSAYTHVQVPITADQFAQFEDIEQSIFKKYRVQNKLVRNLGKYYRKLRVTMDSAAVDGIFSSPRAFGDRVETMVQTAVEMINDRYSSRQTKRKYRTEALDELERVHLVLIGTIALVCNIYDEHASRRDNLVIASASIGRAFAGQAVAT